MRTKELARGKWRGILIELVGPDAVSQKHGPCPICGGTDRYRFDNKQNNGDWFCNVCGVGDGFELLQRALGVDFKEAARLVDSVLGSIDAEPFKQDIDIEKRRSSLNKMWASAQSPEIVTDYLRSRGISPVIIAKAGDLRGHTRLLDRETNSYCHGMAALIRNAAGQPISVHRTFLGLTRKKKIMPPTESTTGGYIRLGVPDKTLVLAEGIESALSAWQITGEPVWALINANNMGVFDAVPKSVNRVIICADNDKSYAGQAAAFNCAFRLRNRRQIATEVWMPNHQEWDMNDVVTQGAGLLDLLKWSE